MFARVVLLITDLFISSMVSVRAFRLMSQEMTLG
jgi:hypothetical protein